MAGRIGWHSVQSLQQSYGTAGLRAARQHALLPKTHVRMYACTPVGHRCTELLCLPSCAHLPSDAIHSNSPYVQESLQEGPGQEEQSVGRNIIVQCVAFAYFSFCLSLCPILSKCIFLLPLTFLKGSTPSPIPTSTAAVSRHDRSGGHRRAMPCEVDCCRTALTGPAFIQISRGSAFSFGLASWTG